jgi:hypothetical protein
MSGVVAFVALYRPSLAFLLCDQYTSQGVFSKKKNNRKEYNRITKKRRYPRLVFNNKAW